MCNCFRIGFVTVGSRIRKEVRQVLYLPQEEGQGMVEYALVLVLVAIVVLAILMILGPQIGNIFSRITSALIKMPG
jgi:pilus assembly protein Flp/PilA